MNPVIQSILGYVKLNKALILSVVGYRGKEVLLTGLAVILILSPVSTTSENHENLAEAAVVEQEPAKQEQVTMEVFVTAYSSTPEETDDTPFITASGKPVRDGIVATNLLPLGTKVQIPEYFGERVFVVEDRMHRRKINFVDIWMPTKEEAEEFGIARTDIVVLD